MCEESLSRLERSLTLAVRRLRALESDNADLRRENQELKGLLEELKQENCDRKSVMDRLREERSDLRKNVREAIRNVAVLENAINGSSAGTGEG